MILERILINLYKNPLKISVFLKKHEETLIKPIKPAQKQENQIIPVNNSIFMQKSSKIRCFLRFFILNSSARRME